jgi:hypothetical protein
VLIVTGSGHERGTSVAKKLKDDQWYVVNVQVPGGQDVTAAERDLRLLLTADKPTANDIVAAGQRGRRRADWGGITTWEE